MKNLTENKDLNGKIKIITYRAGTKEIIRETDWTPNRVMIGTDTGKDIILDRLNGVNTYSLNITHADIGTGTNTPADSDTALQTPIARAAKANGVLAGNVLSLYFFWADVDLTNGTYREFGSFVDGTTTVSTGKIFNRALFASPYVKASSEDTTMQLDITLT